MLKTILNPVWFFYQNRIENIDKEVTRDYSVFIKLSAYKVHCSRYCERVSESQGYHCVPFFSILSGVYVSLLVKKRYNGGRGW